MVLLVTIRQVKKKLAPITLREFIGDLTLSTRILLCELSLRQALLLSFAALWFLNGAGQALISIAPGTLLAEHTREEERGRAYAPYFALTHACWLITYPAIGYAAVC